MAATAILRIDEVQNDYDAYGFLAPIGASIGICIVARSFYMNDFGSAASVIAAVGVTMIGAGYLLTAARKFIVQANKDGISVSPKAPDSSEMKDMMDQEKIERIRKYKERRKKDIT